MTAFRRTTSLIRAAAAVAVMLALVAGVPILLLAMIGNPLPEQWSWDSPLTDEAVLGVIACVAWIFWAQMAVCLIVEVIAEVRIAAGQPADWLSRVPGTLGGQQAIARALVQAVVAVGITSAIATTSANPWLARADATVTPATSAHEVAAPSTTQSRPPTSIPQHVATQLPTRATTVQVAKGDSLWSIAEQHLGSGERWKEIAQLNEGRQMPDGNRFLNARSILPGWTLLVPGAATVATAQDLITVERGDTLWGLAEETYDAGEDWPQILDVNREKIADPDLIFPGQRLRIPATHGIGEEQLNPPEDYGDSQPGGPKNEPSEEPTSPPSEVVIPMPADTTPPVAENDPTTDTNQPEVSDEEVASGSLARALIGSGVFLAAGLLAALVARRRNQFRTRRSGRTIARMPLGLVDTEQAVRATGSAGGESARFLDLALRDLAAQLRLSGGALPEVRAARLNETHLELFLAEPVPALPTPWESAEGEACWRLARDHQPGAEHAIAPYPTLVSIGADDDGASWLLDVEAAGLVQLSGDSSAAADLARFMAAELAMNPWATTVDVTLSGVGNELVPLNPARLSAAETLDIEHLTKAARRVREATEATGLGVLEGRLDGLGADSWMPSILLADLQTKHVHSGEVEGLLDELSGLHGRSAVALVAVGPAALAKDGVRLTIDRDGRLVTPWATLAANRLGRDEAKALAELFATYEPDSDDEPMPITRRGDGTTDDADVAGALIEEVTDARSGAGEPTSLLPRPDVEYVAAAATTCEDLAVLAPQVSPELRDRVVNQDASLEADLAAWSDASSHRPKLRLLGPVEVQVAGDSPHDVERRTAYYAELVAYLATRPEGATPQHMAEAFSMQTNSLHSRIGTLRKWLGTDQATERWYLPESTLSAASKARGVPIYQLDGVLCDADLFKRLRTRGQARGPVGMEDLVSALKLVTGMPFDQLRPGGYGWLAENPVDHYLTAAVVDVAHLVATHALTEGEPGLAAWAAERAITAAPSEDKPRLDLARAQIVLGHVDDAEAYVAREIFNRSDDDGAPPEPSPRTIQILGLAKR